MRGLLATTGLLCEIFRYSMRYYCYLLCLENEGRALETRAEALNGRNE